MEIQEGEIVDIDLDIDGKVMPTKIDKIALIDADTVAYIACLNTEVGSEILGKEFYADEEWDAIMCDPMYVEAEEMLYETNPELALAKAEEKMQRILDKTGCSGVELHFSGGKKTNFRFDVSPIYKANRTTRTPAGLGRLKKDLCEKYSGAIHTAFEADDAVVHLALKHPEKYILVCIDKDVMHSVPGTNFNYYERAASTNKYGTMLKEINMQWEEVDRYTAMTWRYLQTLMGDKTDNIEGIKGIGPKKAEKIIAGKMTHKELWLAVCEAYVMAGRTRDEALMNLNLVDMRLLQDDGTIKLRTHEELLND